MAAEKSGFTVKVTPASDGGGGDSFELDQNVVKSVTYKTDTPDDSNARSHDVGCIMIITGEFVQAAEENTKKMAKWTLEKDTPYKNVVVKSVATSGTTIREYTFTCAFVVDYTEEFADVSGHGTFTLVIKQRKDKNDEVKIEGGYK
jgi:hypothetical protein